jgi:hypothetical protein
MMGEILVNKKIISLKQLDEALDLQRNSGEKLGEAIVKLGFATKEDIEKAIADK